MKRQYDHQKIEKKWRKVWEDQKLYEVDPAKAAKPFYCLDMFPYPSAQGLHVGHWRGYILSDFYARYYRLKGYDVLHPMGYDAFGLNAENAAIKHKSHPKKFTDQAIKTFGRQLAETAAAYDWTKTLSTADPSYYRWTQWLFLQFLKHGLAEKRQSLVNWCPKDLTVLANEQVIDGCCERCGSRVTKKELSQWFIKTTAFAEELISGLEKVDWPGHLKAMQRDWIGKSEGATVSFPVTNDDAEKKPNFVILHGFTGRNDKNFIPWLKTELEKAGYKVQAPQLPNTDNPTEEEQVNFVVKNVTLDQNSIIIGHSLGAEVAMKALIKHGQKINRLVLVAPVLPPKYSSRDIPKKFWANFGWDVEYAKVKDLAGQISLLSDNQEPHRVKYINFLKDQLSASVTTVKATDEHFTANEEPAILEALFSIIAVFTTRLDTIFGVTALVLAPEHPLAETLVTKDRQKDFETYQKQVAAKTNVDRAQGKESAKTAFFTGSYALHPLTDEKLPIWLADYVLMDYGTGAVMSVPAHDERDFLFAKAHDLPIKEVVAHRFVQTTEPGIYRPNEPTKTQDGVIAFVKHWRDDTYIALKWKEVAWGTLLTGSVDDGETPEETLIKEIREETGYKHAKIVAKLGVADGLFYHVPKKTNKLVHGHIFVAELQDDARDTISDDENSKHDIEWKTKEELATFLTPETHRYALELLENGYRPYAGDGSLVNSGEFTGLDNKEAAEKIMAALEKKGAGQKTTTYRLRDWLVSRQRYWGAPIPIVYDPQGQAHPVKDEHLPLELPTDVDFLPGGVSPLARSVEYKKRAEKLYGPGWHFETDTLDTFVDSSWYFLRYLSPTDGQEAFNKELVKKWLPVDLYIGHNVPHLLYARLVTKFLARYGYIDSAIDEPFKRLFDIGMITLHGTKMSKSRGNVISPDELVEHYGTDALRGYELFIGPMDVEAEWNPRGINGVHRFLISVNSLPAKLTSDDALADDAAFNKYLAEIEPMIKDFRLNTVISAAMKLVNIWQKQQKVSQNAFAKFVITLSPTFPFIAEELWAELGHKESVFRAEWPKAAEIKASNEISVLINQKFAAHLTPKGNSQPAIETEALAIPAVKTKLAGKKVVKVIYRPGQLLNVVTG